MAWRGRVHEALSRNRDQGVVIAVSGGADSVGLLRFMHEMREAFDLRLSVAHLDHGTRGDVSRADAEFVAQLAASLDLPFDLGRWSPTRPGHFEADARKARYDWLVEVAKSRGASCVAVGHTRDDQAETILHRILRGTGPRGLAGMPQRRPLAEGVTLVRPLLDVGRDDVRGYLAEIGQPFCEDASNEDLARTRNRIRHDLLPKLAAEYNPKVAEALVRLGAFARDELLRRTRRVEKIARKAILSADPAAIVVSRGALEGHSPSMRAEVFREAWRRAGWPERRMSAARWLRLASPPDGWVGRYSVVKDVDVVFTADVVRLFMLGPDPRSDV
jgi:tRNA(Ile)-lysidine synthase